MIKCKIKAVLELRIEIDISLSSIFDVNTEKNILYFHLRINKNYLRVFITLKVSSNSCLKLVYEMIYDAIHRSKSKRSF